MTNGVLHGVLQAAHRPGAVVAFDLDSTIIDNRPRQVRIFHEFALRRGVAELLATRAEHWTSWDICEAMRNAGLPADRAAALHQEVSAFWWDRFFNGDYCRWDEPVPGAADLVGAVLEAGATVAYVTGRHEPMREGFVRLDRRLDNVLTGVHGKEHERFRRRLTRWEALVGMRSR